jgi:hypothetical protein
MVESFYDVKVGSFDESLNEKWSPAEVNQILFRNFKNIEKAIEEINNLTSEDLYGFSMNNTE